MFINILVQLIHRLLFIVSEIEEKCENCVEKISSSFLFDRYFEGSAGIGRTGMLILMDTAISLLNVNEPVYPLDIVRNMRDQRPCMVQNVVGFQMRTFYGDTTIYLVFSLGSHCLTCSRFSSNINLFASAYSQNMPNLHKRMYSIRSCKMSFKYAKYAQERHTDFFFRFERAKGNNRNR